MTPPDRLITLILANCILSGYNTYKNSDGFRPFSVRVAIATWASFKLGPANFRGPESRPMAMVYRQIKSIQEAMNIEQPNLHNFNNGHSNGY